MNEVDNKLKLIIEGLLLAAGKPLNLAAIAAVFEEDERPADNEIRVALQAISDDCSERGFELQEVASGYRFQVKQDLSPWIARLWDEKPQRYTRALLETLSLIAYRQPITRGDIEEIRGVGVSSTIIRTLLDREWIRVVGHRDVPGRPAMFATTRQFLDYFNLRSLQELPPLSEIRDLDKINQELALEDDGLDKMRVLELPDEEDPEKPGPGEGGNFQESEDAGEQSSDTDETPEITEAGEAQADASGPGPEQDSTDEADEESGEDLSEEDALAEEEAIALAEKPLDQILGTTPPADKE